MNVKYNFEKDQAIRLYAEYFKYSPLWKRRRLLLVPLAILGACIFSAFQPIEAYHYEEYNLKSSIIATVTVQTPVVSLLLYAFLRVLFRIPSKTIIAGLKKQPDDLWGERILEIDANEVTLRRNVMTSSFKKSFIDDVVETPSGYHVLHGKIILFAIPRSACSFEELMSKLK